MVLSQDRTPGPAAGTYRSAVACGNRSKWSGKQRLPLLDPPALVGMNVAYIGQATAST